MSNPTRLANKTQWALADVTAACARGKRALMAMRERNEKLMDPMMSIQITALADVLAKIEVTTVRAQHGEYVQEIEHGDGH